MIRRFRREFPNRIVPLASVLAGLCGGMFRIEMNAAVQPHDARIAVRAGRSDDSAAALAGEVKAVADSSTLSRAKKERQISAAVRTAVMAATNNGQRPAEVLEFALELVGAAGSAAPGFAEVIARAAGFAPPVAKIAGGAARVRAAAYAGSKFPRGHDQGIVTRIHPEAAGGHRETAAVSPSDRASAPARVEEKEAVRTPAGDAKNPATATPAGILGLFGNQAPAALPALPSGRADDKPAGSPPVGDEKVPATQAPTRTPDDPFGLFGNQGGSRVASAEPVPRAAEKPVETSPATPTIGGIAVPGIQLPVAAPAAPAAASEPAGASNTAGTANTGDVLQMEKFTVESTPTIGSAVDLRLERSRAAVAIDFLSSDQLAKYAVGDLSEVVFRIPGISVPSGQFAVVRGLSDRFLSTTLQGIKLPTPDPEKQAVQLDLLPASAVEAVVVSKTYDSSLWAESSGGNMDIRTRAIPSERQFKVSFGLKVNSNAADGGPDYRIRGSTAERFGFGSRSRLAVGENDPAWQYVPQYRRSFPVGNKLSLEYAREFPVGSHQLGLLVSAFNEASYKLKSGRRQPRFAARGEAPRPATQGRPASTGLPSDFEKDPKFPSVQGSVYDYRENESEYVTGVTTALGYRFSPDHEVKFTGIFVQSGIDQVQVNETALTEDPATGLPTTIGPPPKLNYDRDFSWFKTYEYFRERNLTTLQLSGRHKLPYLGGLGATWAAQRGTSYQKDHPFIESVFITPLTDLHRTYYVLAGSDAPTPIFAVWADNRETQNAARLDFDWHRPLWGEEEVTFKFGGAIDSTNRDVTGLGNIMSPSVGSTGSDPGLLISQAARTVGGSFATANTASREIVAYYANAIFPLLPKLKIVGGARFEDFSLSVTGVGRWGNYSTTTFYADTIGGGQFGRILGTTATDNPPFESRKWYPGAGLIFEPAKSLVVRLGYSATTGRPSLREVSPFFNKSIETGNLVVGNPALAPAPVRSYDARVEWSPSRTFNVSLSLFQKAIRNPIEKLLLDTGAVAGELTETWVNNPTEAEVKGFEFEFAHGLGAWTELLREFSISGNFTAIRTEVDENPIVVSLAAGAFQDRTKIPLSRQLFDQPGHIGNLELTWAHRRTGTSATVTAYTVSDTLSTSGLPVFSFDVYDRAYTRYDFLFNQQLSPRLKLKLALKNLTDPVRGSIYDREATSELVVRHEYRAGRDYSLSVTADF